MPSESISAAIGEEAEIFQVSYFDELPVAAKQINQATSRDPVWLAYEVVQDGNVKPYFVRRHELSADQGCVLWGRRVVIPPCYRERILDDLHDQHLGMCRMKALARSYLWWPKSDQDIEVKVRGCGVC